jgi:hypothetical protein
MTCYVCADGSKVYDVESWKYPRPKDFMNKLKRNPQLPTLNYKIQEDELDCLLVDVYEDYEFLLEFQNKKYYILKELKTYIEKCNKHSIKVHDRLKRIKQIQENQHKAFWNKKEDQHREFNENKYHFFGEERYVNFFWSHILSFKDINKENKFKSHGVNLDKYPEALPDFEWIWYETPGFDIMCGEAGILEVNWNTEKYNRFIALKIS